jgi:hypothetical protein
MLAKLAKLMKIPPDAPNPAVRMDRSRRNPSVRAAREYVPARAVNAWDGEDFVKRCATGKKTLIMGVSDQRV